jgi:hypothetical protein
VVGNWTILIKCGSTSDGMAILLALLAPWLDNIRA